MQAFDFQLRPRIVYGPGVIARLGVLVRELGCRRALVVSDEGVVKAGHFSAGVSSLEQQGVQVHSFHEFAENPTTVMVERGLEVARRCQPDILIGLGGGSSLDCCKGINFVYSCGGSMRDYQGIGKATADLLPTILVPTTAGTGSESQSFALISDAETHVKMACGDPRAACRVAVLDPELTMTMPPRVTALTGIDAISHAIETYVTKKRNSMSQMFSRYSFGLLATGFSKVLSEPNNVEARGQMQLGACMAGMAIESSMLGAAHATANPLTARYGIAHGQAVGVMLPSVIRLNGLEYSAWYAELLREFEAVEDVASAPDRMASLVEEWMELAALSTSLAELGVAEESIEELSSDAASQWTGTFNPVLLTHQRLIDLYKSAR